MTTRAPRPGDVFIASFPEHDPRGHEQEGLRPAVVLAVPSRSRFPVLLVAPLTTDRGQEWASAAPGLYPRLPKGAGGLPADSIVLLDQTRSIDAVRVRRMLGTLEKTIFKSILAKWLSLFR
ncbi:MAG: type II toxin-antitoxin system PemK/MazF family toxin [Deltaproteobacteria bacterium]|nr:type II toxin-antitoxin system PemK/MazF family toxin [Deltaproteobacteria bacterium]